MTEEVVMVVARLLASAVLGSLYVLGWLAGGMVVLALTVTAAVRLGWSDARKRGEHGAA